MTQVLEAANAELKTNDNVEVLGTDQVPSASDDIVKPETERNDTTAIPAGQTLSNGVEEEDAEADSEAETLIQSPEKKRILVENAALQNQAAVAMEPSVPAYDTIAVSPDRPTRKRKRDEDISHINSPSRTSSHRSSPLSSPIIPAADSNSELSDRINSRGSRGHRGSRNDLTQQFSPESEKSDHPRSRKRRPSDILPHPRVKASGQTSVGDSERRETRSATYPRHTSEEKSPSPERPTRREHRRGVSTQLTSTEFDRKRRGRPALINTRRKRSADRASTSSESGSPAPSRPTLHKFTSQDHDTLSPAKQMGPRKYRDKSGRTFLARCASNDDLEGVRLRFAERPEDLDIPENAGNTPLQIAALGGFTDIVEFLLQQGCLVDPRNIDKETPLIDAVENGHLEVVKLLLQYGADPRGANAKGEEPYELVRSHLENREELKTVLKAATENSQRRRSGDQLDLNHRDGTSSRAASAASPRDSPPFSGPRSPPPPAHRRKTGRSETTRSDLLWQHHTQENLTKVAARGDLQGVATILNSLQRAEPESVIAAAKAGHEEVLNLLFGLGNANPDPKPVPSRKIGENTPILAAIGRGSAGVVSLLINQSGFDATKRYRDQTYYEIAAERKGHDWEKEYEILKTAYEKQISGKGSKTSSPRKSRDTEKARSRAARKSSSPSTKRQSTSPVLTQQALNRSSTIIRKDKRGSSPDLSAKRRARIDKEDSASVAVASDQDQELSRKKHRVRRSVSDLPPISSLENDALPRRRRLVTGKEHRRRKSIYSEQNPDEGDASAIEVKTESRSPLMLKRNRSSRSPEPEQVARQNSQRPDVKKRRAIPDSSPDVKQQSLERKSPTAPVSLNVDMEDSQAKAPSSMIEDNEQVKERGHVENEVSEQGSSSDIPMHDAQLPETKEANTLQPGSTLPQQETNDESITLDEEATGVAASGSQDTEHIRFAREDEERKQREAAELARKEREAHLEAQRQAVEEQKRVEEAKRIEEERTRERQAAEEAEARRKADEEAFAAKKREEEQRQEQLRVELEERRKRQEEQHRLQHLENERRRREALPASLCRAALMLDQGDPIVRDHQWLTKFLPLHAASTVELDPNCPDELKQELWIPNVQVALLLATKDLNLRNYTSLERRHMTDYERGRVWELMRLMLVYDPNLNCINSSIQNDMNREYRDRPKFMAMKEVFWVKLSDFEDQIFRHPHLEGLKLKKWLISMGRHRVQDSHQSNGTSSFPSMTNGVGPRLDPFAPDPRRWKFNV